MRLLRPLALIGCLMLVPALPSRGETATRRTQDRAQALFPEDARLAKKVTVRRARIYLGELAEELSRQSGVRLSISQTRGPVDGIDLTVYVREQPLRAVMEALRELFQHRQDAWEWRQDRPGGNGYVLYHQRTPEAAAAAARDEMLQRFGDSLREFYRISQLRDDLERSKALRSRPDLSHSGVVPSGQMDLCRTLRLADIDALLRGEEVFLDSAHTTLRGREALTLGVSGLPAVSPERRGGSLAVTWNLDYAGPIMWLRNETGGGVNVVGGQGWDWEWFKSHGEGWWYQGQPEVDEQLRRIEQRDPSAGDPAPADRFTTWMQLAAAEQDLQVIADWVYPDHGTNNFAWLGRTPKQSILTLVGRGGVAGKKRGEFYLVRDKSFAVHPRAHLVPWSFIRHLREVAAKNDGYLRLSELRELCDLNPAQLGVLAEEFPNASAGLLPPWKPILEFYRELSPEQQAQLTSKEGLAIRDAGLVARSALAAPVEFRSSRKRCASSTWSGRTSITRGSR